MAGTLSEVMLRRMTDAMFYGSGARTVLLRIPATANATDPGEQLGFAEPQFQDIELTPVVFRSSTATIAEGKAHRRDLLVPASTVETLVTSLDDGSVGTFFALVVGVVMDEVLLRIAGVSELEAGGLVYAYKLALLEHTSNAV